MALFAEAKEPFLRSFLQLKNGVPSHDTFSSLFRNLDPEQFRTSFQQFMAQFSAQCQGVIAIDGKALRRSFDRASGRSALHMVSAWGCEQRLVLAQIGVPDGEGVPERRSLLSDPSPWQRHGIPAVNCFDRHVRAERPSTGRCLCIWAPALCICAYRNAARKQAGRTLFGRRVR